MALRLRSNAPTIARDDEDDVLGRLRRMRGETEEETSSAVPKTEEKEETEERDPLDRLQAMREAAPQPTKDREAPAASTPAASTPAAGSPGRIRPGWDTADAARASDAQDRREKPITTMLNSAVDRMHRLNDAAGVNIDDLREDLTQRAAERDAADSALGQIVEPWNRANATAQNLRSQVQAFETKLGMLNDTIANSTDPEERRRAQQESQALDLYYQKAQRAAERYESRFQDLNTQFQQAAIARNKANKGLQEGLEQYNTLLSLGDKRAKKLEQEAEELRAEADRLYRAGEVNAPTLRLAEQAEARAAQERQNYAEYLYGTKGQSAANRYLSGEEAGNRMKAEQTSFAQKVLNTVGGAGANWFSNYGGSPLILMADLMGMHDEAEALRASDPFSSAAQEMRQNAGKVGGMIIDTAGAAGNMMSTAAFGGIAAGGLAGSSLMTTLTGIAESSPLVTSAAARAGAKLATGLMGEFIGNAGNAAISLSSGVSGFNEARENGASFEQAMTNGVLRGLAEYYSNKLFSGMPLENAPGEKGYVTKAIEWVAEKLGKSKALEAFNKTTGGKVLSWIYDKAGEGLEEVVTGLLDPVIDRITYDNEADWKPKLDELVDEFIGGVMLSLLMSGGEKVLGPVLTKEAIVDELVSQGIPRAEARKYAGPIYQDMKAAEKVQKAIEKAMAEAQPAQAAEARAPAEAPAEAPAPRTVLQQKAEKYAAEGKLSGQDARDILADPDAKQALIDAGLITGREMNDSAGRTKVAQAAEQYIRNMQAEEQTTPPVPGQAEETATPVQAEAQAQTATVNAETPPVPQEVQTPAEQESAPQAGQAANTETSESKTIQRTLAAERQKTAGKAESLQDYGFTTAGDDATARVRNEENWDAEEQAVGQALRDLGYEPTFAAGIIQNAEGDSVPYLVEGNKIAIRADSRRTLQTLAEQAVGKSLDIDQSVRTQAAEAITQARESARTERQAAAETPKVSTRYQAAVDSARAAGASEENGALAGRLAEALGRDIVFINDPARNGAWTNGYTKDGVIYINAAANKRTVAWVIGHELTHNVEDSKYYTALKRLAKKQLGLNWGQKVNSRIAASERVAQKLGDDSVKVDRDGAEREIVADFFADKLLTDEAAIRAVCEYEPATARNIRDYIKGLLRKLGGKETTLEKAVKLYSKALKDVEAKAQAEAEKKLQLPREKAKSAADIRNAKYSIQSIFDAAGFKVTMRGGRVIAKDSNGNRIAEMTEDMVCQSGIGTMIRFAQETTKTISKAEADTQIEGLTRLFNLMLKAQDGDMVWRFAGSAMFSAVKSNSDGQYRTTVDFSTVCKKTQEMMETMSRVMVKTHKGLTKAEIIELQNDILEENGLVPCPVCYVFSRWAGVGGILDNMAKYQRKYDGAEWDDPERVKARIDQLKAATKSKKSLRELLVQEDASYMQYTGELEANKDEQKQLKDERKKLTGKKANAEENAARVAEIDQRLKELTGLQRMLENDIKGIESSGAPEAAWLERVRMSNRYREEGYVDEDLLYNLLAADELAERKPLAWGYRTSRGPSAGKAILPYSDMRLGDWILGPGKNSAKGENLLFSSVGENFNTDQAKAISTARQRVLAQNLIGGQRYQSTSDFMYDYGLDYLLSFFEGQMLGSKMQTYTKVMEFVNLVASVHGDVNISMMPLDAGYVTEADGRKHLIYSSVTGANPEAAIRANHLFDNAQLILVGINDEHILLALEDSEETGGIEIGFVIPYHASGASINNFIRGLVENLKESFNEENYKNYEPMQNDVHRKGATATQEAREHLRHYLLTGKRGKTEVSVSANENGLTEAEMKLLKGKNKDISGMSFEELRAIEKAALQGDKAAIKEYESWSAGILGDIYKKMWVDKKARDTYGVRLATTQAEHIMPHEYWDKSVDRAHAYVNGFIFRSYCYSLGLTPRFTGFDSSGRKLGYGDFSDSTGYWKTLIDRPMYDRRGKYRDQQTMNVTELSSSITGEYVEGQAGSGAGMLSPEYGREFWGENAQTPDTGVAARAAERYLERQYSAEDSDYLAAVESGDMETAQRMVNEAAKQAGYNRIGDYYIDNQIGLTEPEPTKRQMQAYELGQKYGDTDAGYRRLLMDDPDTYERIINNSTLERWYLAGTRGTMPEYRLAIRYGDVPEGSRSRNWGTGELERGTSVVDFLTSQTQNGQTIYDAIYGMQNTSKNIVGGWDFGIFGSDGEPLLVDAQPVVAFSDVAKIKSAAPVTYDDDGNVIPLSERFNTKETDIRYSAEDSDDEYRQTPQTPALEKLGVRLAGSKGRYDLSEQLLDRDKGAKELMKATKKAERKLNATKAEKEFAAGIASGIYDEADIPSTMDKDKVTTLADYYTAEESFKLNMLSEVRGMINEEYQDEAEGLLKDVDGFKKLSMLQMNERTPDRTFRAMFGPEQGKQIFDWLIRPVQLNEAEKTRWHQTQLDRVRKFKDSKGKTRELTRDESALTMLVMEGKAAAQAVADLEADAEKGNAIKQAARDLSRGMTQAEAAEKYGLTEKEVILAQRYRQGAQERAQREVANLVAKEDTAQRIKNAAENIRNGEDPGDAAWEFGLKDNERDMAVNYATWMDTQEKLKNEDSTIIETAAKEYAKIFDEFYDAINDFLVAHGYEPIGYIKGYAPHMQPEETQNLLEKAFDKMGIDLGNDKAQGLPANIAGETAYFKPNKRWDPYFLHRTGTKAEYDIVKAYQSYVGYLSDILYHTDDIMRVRNMEKMIRKTYAPDDISEVLSQIKFIRSAPVEDRLSFLRDAGKIGRTTQLSTDEINDKLDEWEEEQYQALAEDKQYNNLVMWLSNYANILAGKQSFADRGWEYSLGRNSLNFANRLQAAFQRSLVAGSLTSALNQTAQLPMIKAELGDRYYYQAALDILRGKTKGFWQDSDFLTSKHGVDMLYTDNYDQFISALFTPSTVVDNVVSTIAVRGAFLKAVNQGQSYSEAMKTADDFGRKVMGSREKGTRPLAYESKGLFSRMVHMFQVEAANSWDHIASDLPYEIKHIAKAQGKTKAARTLAALLIRGLLSTFLLNRITEEVYGGTPAPFDVIGLALNFVASGEGMTTNQKLRQIIDNVLEQVGQDRYFGTQSANAEFDVGKGLEELGYNVMNDVPLLRNLAGVLGLGDQTVPLPGAGGEFKDVATAVSDIFKDGADGQNIENLIRASAKLGAQFVPAGRQLTKTGEGIEAVIKGGSYSKKGKLQYTIDDPEDKVRAILFGKNSTTAAQEHWASGENTLSEKQTDLVEKLRGQKMSGAEARNAVQTVKSFSGDDKRDQTVAYIDSLNITNTLKDELYYYAGYKESTIDSTPWHGGSTGGKSGKGKTYAMANQSSLLANPSDRMNDQDRELYDMENHGGNVNLRTRKTIPVTKDNIDTVRGWGMDSQVGDYMTVASQTYRDGSRAIVVTPILPSGKLMTQAELDAYMDSLRGSDSYADADDRGIILGVFDDGNWEQNLKESDAFAERIHELHEEREEKRKTTGLQLPAAPKAQRQSSGLKLLSTPKAKSSTGGLKLK